MSQRVAVDTPAPAPSSPSPASRDLTRVRTRRRRRRAGVAVRLVLAVGMCAVLLFPLYWMVVVALSSRAELLGGTLRLWPRELTLENLERVFASFPVLTWFGNRK